jgi:hypothetical protein
MFLFACYERLAKFEQVNFRLKEFSNQQLDSGGIESTSSCPLLSSKFEAPKLELFKNHDI